MIDKHVFGYYNDAIRDKNKCSEQTFGIDVRAEEKEVITRRGLPIARSKRGNCHERNETYLQKEQKDAESPQTDDGFRGGRFTDRTSGERPQRYPGTCGYHAKRNPDGTNILPAYL